jgi:PAS domain S-box-containing protein
MEAGQTEVVALVTPDRPGVIEESLDSFWGRLPAASSRRVRGPLDTAVAELGAAVVERARPQLVRLRLRLAGDRVLASLSDSGEGWAGPPAPAELVEDLRAGSPAFREAAGRLAGIEHTTRGRVNRWHLSLRVDPRSLRPRTPRPRRSFRARLRRVVRVGVAVQAALAGVLAGALATVQLTTGAPHTAAVAVACLAGGATLPLLPLLLVLAPRVLRELDGLSGLVQAAGRVQQGAQDPVPGTQRTDELGELARAVRHLRQSSAQWELLMERAPIGIATVGVDGRCTSVSRVLAEAFHGRTREEMEGQPFADTLDPEDRERLRAPFLSMLEGRQDRYVFETRHARQEGTATVMVVPVRGPDGRPESFITIVEDTTERSQQQRQAMELQRHLLPSGAPVVAGYEFAGVCRPAMNMSGDFYDWSVPTEGQLDLTLADVMGKGMGAALMMAALRTALRAAPTDLPPAERVRQAASSLSLSGMDEEGFFVTLFHARLDALSGLVRFVDAGHGHWAIRRADGRLLPSLQPRSLPLFVLPGLDLREGQVWLEPGDTLVVYSDGLVEAENRTGELADYRQDLDQAASASDLVRLLMGRMQPFLSDDVTTLVVRRSLRHET